MKRRDFLRSGMIGVGAVLSSKIFGLPLLANAQDNTPDVPFEDQVRNGYIQGRQDAAAAAAEYQRTDQITVLLIGTTTPASRTGAQTSAAVFVNGQFLIFDVGNNALSSMYASNLSLEEVDSVFLTHYHNDHFADLGELMQWSWINGRRRLLPVYGPTGLTQILDGFSGVYGLDRSYRVGHHGADIMPLEFAGTEAFEFVAPEGDDPVVVYENDGVTVEAFRATHEPIRPNVGYRIKYADTLVVISSDTILTSAVLANSQDADLLIADVMNHGAVEVLEQAARENGDERNAKIFFDIRDYHMDVRDAGELAQQANVKRLALTHLTPNPGANIQMNQWFVNPIRAIYEGEIIASRDGTAIVVPLNAG